MGRPSARSEATLGKFRKHRTLPDHHPPLLAPWDPTASGGSGAWSLTLSVALAAAPAPSLAPGGKTTSRSSAKPQVRGREMHWIRIDRCVRPVVRQRETAIELGDDNAQMIHQPVPCMQCEDARAKTSARLRRRRIRRTDSTTWCTTAASAPATAPTTVRGKFVGSTTSTTAAMCPSGIKLAMNPT